jgi:hypothetical protein
VASNRALVRRPQGHGLPRRGWIVAIGLFLVLDIALVALALNGNRSPTAAGELALESPGLSAVPSESGAPAPTVAPTAAVPQRLLAAINADVAWRGVVGSCPDGQSELEYTVDGGESWEVVDPAGTTDANTLVRLVPASSTEAHVVTLDDECSPQLLRTFVAGEAWEDYTSSLGSYWYVGPADRANVHSPYGTIPGPCGSVVAVAPRSSSEALVLCADQALFETRDAGAEWSTAISVSGAVAIDASNGGYVVAVAAQADCAGVSVVALTDGLPSAALGCSGDGSPDGQTSLAVADDDTLWLWAGEHFLRSTDGGETWN